MFLPRSRSGRIATGLLVVFALATTPPIVLLVNEATLVLGTSALYLWTVAWGVFVSLVLIWAAWRDAFALTEDQVPPELRDAEDVVTTRPNEEEAVARGDH